MTLSLTGPVAQTSADTSAATVQSIRKELSDILPQYNKISDCLDGSDKVKAQTTTYLPIPDAEEPAQNSAIRYKSYIQRAQFYPVTRRTLSGLIGQIFVRDPKVTVPTELEIIQQDCNGEGVTLVQQAKRACALVTAFGRGGLWVDYPKTDGAPTTRKQQLDGEIRPTIMLYNPKDVTNWRTKKVGAKTMLSLVVLKEEYDADGNEFQTEKATQYRVLKLDADNRYTVQLWREVTPGDNQFVKYQAEIVPTDANGQPFSEIPFLFVGSEDNSFFIDPAPLYDLADLNIGHYRNSADYEEMTFIVGQVTVAVSGLKQEWYDNVLKKKIRFGSRGGIPLNEGATVQLLQAQSDSLPFEAMTHKEEQMVALGARLVEKQSVQRTAYETGVELVTETSILGTVAKNVSAAFLWALQKCCEFMGVDGSKIEFVLNDEFDIAMMSPEERVQLMKEWQAGAITFTEYRRVLHKVGVAFQDDDEARDEINADSVAAAEALAATDNTPTNLPE